MDTKDFATAGITKIQKEYYAKKEELKRQVEPQLVAQFQHFMELFPQVKTFGWTQSNGNWDDSNYYFAISDLFAELEEEYATSKNLPIELHGNPYEGFIECYLEESNNNVSIEGDPVANALSVLAVELEQAEEMLEDCFGGNFVNVVVTKDGITVK